MSFLKNNGIKAVGFDAFGTLIESKNTSSKYFYSLIKKYKGNTSKIKLLTTNYSSNPEDFYIETFSNAGINFNSITNEEKEKLILLFKSDFENYKLINKTEQLLETVKNQVDYIFLISNLSSIYIPVIQKLGLENYFNFILYSCEVGCKKTPNNKKIFNISYQELKKREKSIKKNEILFTGDNNIDDIKSAKRAGLQAINIEEFRKIILNQ